ncbi:NAD(P)-binding domain protein [Fusarium subglutinans]|uniref:NAD(P)-binding domain protein n=1 Tax=Gibberella subglutinans TaxID=42677 RepID=A0A8H5V606_GIBSU|nr:NAD(P)-binding domain protein [Fusarium subglutinans]KAF5612317.1 NAD(P)-binding domain protein [Fusarium subglutinans]
MSRQAQGRKIAIIGSSGQVGQPTVKALLAPGIHTITAVQRIEATSTFPPEVIVTYGDLKDEFFLASTFQGHDAVVLMPPLPHLVSLQEPAVRAAAKAGVPYILPAEFGPDPFSSKLIEDNQLLQDKQKIRDLIEELGVSSWISVAVGPFLDMNIKSGLWGIDVANRKATIWTGAVGKVNTSSVAQTGQATAAVLSLPGRDLSRCKNKAFYVPSFRLSQKELLLAVQKATGTADQDWEIDYQDVNDAMKDCNGKIQQKDAAAPFVKFFLTHFREGSGGDFESKVDVSEVKKLHEIGLQKEAIDDVLERTVS